MAQKPASNPLDINAKVIIPLALGAWLVGVVVVAVKPPAIVDAALIVAFAVTVPAVVFYLIAAAGWGPMAKRYRARVRFAGEWQLCATGQMARVSVHDPRFDKVKMRFVGGAMSMATSGEGLHLSTMFSRLPVLSWFLPELNVPWSAVKAAHEFEAPGWYAPPSEPGALLQAGYDPNYTGKFIEMEIGEEPVVYVQLPAAMLGEAVAPLPLRAGAAGEAS
jgi:hypothetical protein